MKELVEQLREEIKKKILAHDYEIIGATQGDYVDCHVIMDEKVHFHIAFNKTYSCQHGIDGFHIELTEEQYKDIYNDLMDKLSPERKNYETIIKTKQNQIKKLENEIDYLKLKM